MLTPVAYGVLVHGPHNSPSQEVERRWLLDTRRWERFKTKTVRIPHHPFGSGYASNNGGKVSACCRGIRFASKQIKLSLVMANTPYEHVSVLIPEKPNAIIVHFFC